MKKFAAKTLSMRLALELFILEAVTAAMRKQVSELLIHLSTLTFLMTSKEQGVEMKMKVTVYPEVKLGDYKVPKSNNASYRGY